MASTKELRCADEPPMDGGEHRLPSSHVDRAPERPGDLLEPTERDVASPVVRRRWLEWATATAALGSTAVLAYPVTRFFRPPRTPSTSFVSSVDQVPDLQPGASRMLLLEDRPIIVLRQLSGVIRAYHATCPHLGCTVQYVSEREQLFCPCHGARFAADSGRQLAGPAPSPLRLARVELHSGTLTVFP